MTRVHVTRFSGKTTFGKADGVNVRDVIPLLLIDEQCLKLFASDSQRFEVDNWVSEVIAIAGVVIDLEASVARSCLILLVKARISFFGG